MNWHKFVWPFVLTAMIVSFISGNWIVAASIFVGTGVVALAAEFISKRRAH